MSKNPTAPNAVIAIIYGASTTSKSTICNLLTTELPELAIDGTDLAHEEYQREKARCLAAREPAPKRPTVFDMFDRAIANSQAGIPTILDM